MCPAELVATDAAAAAAAAAAKNFLKNISLGVAGMEYM
jgi:hypothetical protein